jgi:hypothetical protein
MTPSIMEGWLLVFQVLLQATGCLLIDEANDDVLYMACLKSSEIHSSFTSAGNQDDLPTLSKVRTNVGYGQRWGNSVPHRLILVVVFCQVGILGWV